MSWYLVVGDSAEQCLLEVLVRATDCDAACHEATLKWRLERVWSVVPAMRDGDVVEGGQL